MTTPPLSQLQAKLRTSRHPDSTVAVHPDLASAFGAGLHAGGVHTIFGSATIALGLLAAPSKQGSWCAAVGLPDLGLEAAANWGVQLNRLILVPKVGDHWLTVVADLVEATDVVLAATAPPLPGSVVARLTARLRSRQHTLLVFGDWPQPLSQIRATPVDWEGLAQGHGCLTGQRVRVEVTTRSHRRSTEVIVR